MNRKVKGDVMAESGISRLSLQEAAERVVMEKLPEPGGYGGIIVIDRFGNIAMPFMTAGMHRGYVIDDAALPVVVINQKSRRKT
jgi:L-asparaginase / beta-aspartyl-peptidase